MLIFETIIVYTFLAILMCLCAYHSQNGSNGKLLWACIPIVLFTLVFGLRYGVGIDYNNYVYIYNSTKGYKLIDFWTYERYEWGFSLIVYLCHLFNAPVYVFFSTFAFLQILLIYLAFKDEGNVLTYIYATFILTGVCMLGFMNVMRQALAFCIFMFSLKYVRDNKLLPYWCCCLLALAFHHSALLLFPLNFIWWRRKGILNKPLIELLIVLISFVFVFLGNWQSFIHKFDVLITLIGYEGYTGTADILTTGGGRGIGVFGMFELLITCLIIFQSPKMKTHYQSGLFNILYDIFIAGVCLEYIFNGSLLLERLVMYFTSAKFILLAYFLCYLYHERRASAAYLLKYCVVALFLMTNYTRFIMYSENNTGAYVSYFQYDLHKVKDNQRNNAVNNR